MQHARPYAEGLNPKTSATSWVSPLDPKEERNLGIWVDEGLTLPHCDGAVKRANAACKC